MSAVQTNRITRKLKFWWDSIFFYRYYILLMALLSMLVIPTFSEGGDEGFLYTLTRTFVLVACVNVLRNLKRSIILFVMLGLLATGSDWLHVLGVDSDYTNIIGLLLFSFFVGMISYEVFKQLVVTNQTDMHTIVGAFCGFMLIGVIASLAFTLLHIGNPESFKNVGEGMTGVSDLFYFSYITILTIGYGDIAPLTSQARGVALFFGLIGQFYLVVIMAVLVGKFISKTK